MYDQASYTQDSPVSQKQIVAGGTYTTRVVLLTGAAALILGTVLGEVLDAANATVTPGTPVSGTGGTVGNGAVGAWTSDDGAQEGTWRIEITTTTSDAGKFKVVRPDGTVDGIGTVGVAYNGGINGTLADGANDWKAGDVIPVVVSYDHSANAYKESVAAATDGSQIPALVLAQDADASDDDVEALTYETGQMVGSALTLGTGHTIDSIREGLRRKGLLIDD